ncbi:hypothetical protein B0T14DRAFT_297680 [Immersiella caudata]|uniref:Uncharacterized protein n=1 Tax=Immersiella caudata TaxID=314043 RepID=A0AA39WEW4_9PEZI|nr:hypothetical protein B0T14DRAFT_297680 [Immersiella caudata]
MDHVTNTRPTAHNPRPTCSSDVRAEEASARPTRIRYTWSCIMFAAPPARADKTAEPSLRGTCVMGQARRPRTSHLSAQRSAPATTRRTRRDHSVCCHGKGPFSVKRRTSTATPNDSARPQAGPGQLRVLHRARRTLADRAQKSWADDTAESRCDETGAWFCACVPLRASNSGQRLPIAVLVFVPERQSPRSAVCPTPSGPLLPASSHACRLVSPGLSFRRPSQSCPCLSTTRRSPRCRSATAPAGGIWLTFHVSLALSRVRHLSSPQDRRQPLRFLFFFCFFFSFRVAAGKANIPRHPIFRNQADYERGVCVTVGARTDTTVLGPHWAPSALLCSPDIPCSSIQQRML